MEAAEYFLCQLPTQGTLLASHLPSFPAPTSTQLQRTGDKLTPDIQRVFKNASNYAEHAGRSTPHARDLYIAQEMSGWDVGKLRGAAKRKRQRESGAGSESLLSPARQTLITLPSFPLLAS